MIDYLKRKLSGFTRRMKRGDRLKIDGPAIVIYLGGGRQQVVADKAVKIEYQKQSVIPVDQPPR